MVGVCLARVEHAAGTKGAGGERVEQLSRWVDVMHG